MELLPEATYGHAKGGCYRCGVPGPVVDMDTHIEGEGTLALCPPCIREAADTALIRPPEDPVVQRAMLLQEQLANMRDQIEDANTIVTTLFNAWKRIERRKAVLAGPALASVPAPAEEEPGE